MRLVADASVLAAALLDDAPHAQWARRCISDASHLAAPHHTPAEVVQVLRRASWRSVEDLSGTVDDLADLRLDLHPFAPFGPRVWELRDNLTAYDGWYVALAEALDAPLATLDQRLAAAPGPRCAWMLPDDDGIR